MGDLTFVIFSGLVVILNIGPVCWQFQQRNSGAISMGVWVMALNLKDLVNATVWYNDAVNRAPIWCDISNKIRIGGEIGRLASVMCIARFLAIVVSPRATAITREDRRARAIFDYTLCFGAPFLVGACEILYQPSRFAIVRTLGCEAVHSNTWPTLVLWLVWPPIFAAIGVFYSMYTIYRLIKHRRNFGRVVAGAHSALTTSRFIRLAAVSFAYLLVGLPLAIYSTLVDIASNDQYYDYNWAYVHSYWDADPIIYYPDANPSNKVGLSVWSNVVVAIIFFLAFGFGAEALAIYSRMFQSLRSGQFRDRFSSTDSGRNLVEPTPKWQISFDATPNDVDKNDSPFTRFNSSPLSTDGVKVSVDRMQRESV